MSKPARVLWEETYRGFRGGNLKFAGPVSHPALLELKTSRLGYVVVSGMEVTGDGFREGPYLASLIGPRPSRLLIPPQVHGLRIEKGHRESGFMLKCRARILPIEAARPLVGEVRGFSEDVLAHSGERRRVTLEWCDGPGRLLFRNLDGTGEQVLNEQNGRYRGKVTLPGRPGLAIVDCPGGWSIG